MGHLLLRLLLGHLPRSQILGHVKWVTNFRVTAIGSLTSWVIVLECMTEQSETSGTMSESLGGVRNPSNKMAGYISEKEKNKNIFLPQKNRTIPASANTKTTWDLYRTHIRPI